ncbi:MAG: glycosyltransferase [Alphaproteobacteria bacterium]|nr:glycosyltransferase [Alphaproteobacteria bacterium]
MPAAHLSPAAAPAVSVVIPTHNCLTFLPAAIASIDAQGPIDLEIVIVDDGSTDGTGDWLLERAAADPRIRHLAMGGVGPAAARNAAIAAARAPLVAFLDADDIWLPGKLSAQLAVHRARRDVTFSFCDYRHVTLEGTDLGTAFSYWPHFRDLMARCGSGSHVLPAPKALLFAENVVGTSTVMARRDALQNANGFETQLRIAEDWDLWLRLAEAGPVACINAVRTLYLVRPSSASRALDRRRDSLQIVFDRHAPALLARFPHQVRRARARFADADAEMLVQAGAPIASLAARVKALSLDPSARRAKAALRALADAI